MLPGFLEAVSDLVTRHLETGRQINAYWSTENAGDAEILKKHAEALSMSFEKLKLLPLREEQRALTGEISNELRTYLEIVGKTIQVIGGRGQAGDQANATGIVMTNATGAMFNRIEKENWTDLIRGAVRLAQAIEAGLLSTSRYVFTRNPADGDKANAAFGRAARELAQLKDTAAGSERILRQLNALGDTLPAIQKSTGEIANATAAADAVFSQRKEVNVKLTAKIQELRRGAAAEHRADLHAMDAAAVWACVFA